MALALANVPQILTFSELDNAQIDQVMDFVKSDRNTTKMFAMQAAVHLELRSQEQADTALLAQTFAKLGAAQKDMVTISGGGHRRLPDG